jgi:DNA-directed RNA polymerase specialized sigma24 family protein
LFFKLRDSLYRYFHGNLPKNISADTQDAVMMSVHDALRYALEKCAPAELEPGAFRAIAYKIARNRRASAFRKASGLAYQQEVRASELAGGAPGESADPLEALASTDADPDHLVLARDLRLRVLRRMSKRPNDAICYIRNRIDGEDLASLAREFGGTEDALRHRLKAAELEIRAELTVLLDRETR